MSTVLFESMDGRIRLTVCGNGAGADHRTRLELAADDVPIHDPEIARALARTLLLWANGVDLAYVPESVDPAAGAPVVAYVTGWREGWKAALQVNVTEEVRKVMAQRVEAHWGPDPHADPSKPDNPTV